MKTNRPLPEDVPDPFDAIELAAAHWLARQEFGLSPAETAELERWLAQDFRHARVFAELQQTARVFDRHPEAFAAPARLHVSRLGEPTARVRRPWVRRSAGWLAVAAALAVGGVLTWHSPLNDAREYQLTASTEIGGLRTLALPDGSTVRLNTDSDLAVRFSASERRVQLTRGEARFTVAKDPTRPFFVATSGVAVRAVGTEFVVRLRTGAVDILVTEGRVRVENAAADSLLPVRNSPPSRDAQPANGPVLSAGEQVRVPLDQAIPAVAAVVTEVAPEQIARTLAWQERRLMFEATPLADVVAEFNRYIRHRLVIEDATLGEEKFGGTFHPERYETLISLLEQSFDVVAERRGDTTYLRRRRGP
jgi:transmembrane sensor